MTQTTRIDVKFVQYVMEIAKNNDFPPARTPITQGQAAEKYDVPKANLSRWANDDGWIEYLERRERHGQSNLIDERDVAMIAKLYHFGPKRNKWQLRCAIELLKNTLASN